MGIGASAAQIKRAATSRDGAAATAPHRSADENGGRRRRRPPLSRRKRPMPGRRGRVCGRFRRPERTRRIVPSAGVREEASFLPMSPLAPRQGRSPGGSPLRGPRAEARSRPNIRLSPKRMTSFRLATRRSEDPAFRRTDLCGLASVPAVVSRPETRRPRLGWALSKPCRFRIRVWASPQLPPGGGFVSRPASLQIARR